MVRHAVTGLLLLGAWTLTAAGQQQPFVDRVEVARVLVDVRVLDGEWRPIADLEASDFEVEIGGQGVRVESAEWIGGASEPPQPATATLPTPVVRDAPPRRLVVFLVQKDLERLRITGLMKMGQMVDQLLESLTTDDRVAVLSFDSRLRPWTDFTNNLARVRSILSEDVILRAPGPLSESSDVSLLKELSKAGTRTFGIERALQHVAEALEPLPGAKSIILLGYGFGRLGLGGIVLMDGWDEAVAALRRARVSVFTLNITQADFNSLQAGLQTVSEETGGTYASTYQFPTLAVRRLNQALAGYYVLFVERPDLRPGTHRIEVRLTKRKGTVLARSSYVETAAP